MLARFHERGCGLRRARHIQVRPWRRWEEDAIARVYRQSQSGSFGMLERNRAYWHWLLERGVCDQFYVALDGRDLWDFKESSTQVVGYAAIKGEKIIELAVAPDCGKAGMELLARACGDAIEQDHRQIALCARQAAVTWSIFRARRAPPQGLQAEFCMARLLDPLGLLRMLCGTLAERAAKARARPADGIGTAR